MNPKSYVKKLSIIIFLFIISCDNIPFIDHYLYIPSDSQLQIRAGDTLIYKNQFNSIRKYIVYYYFSGKIQKSQTGTYYKSPYRIIKIQGVKIVTADSLKDIYSNGNVLIQDGNYESPYLDLYDLGCINISKNIMNYDKHEEEWEYDASINWFDELKSLESKYISHYDNIKLNNIEYTNIYTYNGTKEFDTFYYSKRYGFIGYKMRNGNLFNLINKYSN